MLFGDFVVTPNDPALQQRPERLNRVGMNRPHYIFALAMADDAMIVASTKMTIASMFVGRYERHALRYSFTNKTIEGVRIVVLDDPCANCTTPFDCADNDGFADSAARPFEAFARVFVLRFTADISFIHLNGRTIQLRRFDSLNGGADAMAEIPRGFVADAECSLDLPRAHSLFGFAHEVDSSEPLPQWQMGIVEDRSSGYAELIAA